MKKRIDILLFERGYAKSREKAKALVISGNVNAQGKNVKNPSEKFDENCEINLKSDNCPFVSRGALKLKRATEVFNIYFHNKICVDIGASTGGFTDYMLQNGAKRVYAIDVGYGQLDWSLRNNSRVINMERVNARYLTSLNEIPEFVSIDVSFISLNLIFPAVKNICDNNTNIVALIKPQFEAGRANIGKNGVVKDIDTHIEVINNVCGYAKNAGFAIIGLTYSPIKGPSGNIEFLANISSSSLHSNKPLNIKKNVELAHLNFL